MSSLYVFVSSNRSFAAIVCSHTLRSVSCDNMFYQYPPHLSPTNDGNCIYLCDSLVKIPICIVFSDTLSIHDWINVHFDGVGAFCNKCLRKVGGLFMGTDIIPMRRYIRVRFYDLTSVTRHCIGSADESHNHRYDFLSAPFRLQIQMEFYQLPVLIQLAVP